MDNYEGKLFATGDGMFISEYKNILIEKHPQLVDKFFQKFELSDTQLGLVYRNGNFSRILTPGKTYLFWKDVANFSIETIDLTQEFTIKQSLIKILKYQQSSYISYISVPEYQKGVLYKNGKIDQVLDSGEYGFWSGYHDVRVSYIDTREQSSEISGQDILTRDKISIRVNISAYWKISDALKMLSSTQNGEEFLYKEIQFSVREIFSGFTIDELLSDKSTVDSKILELSKDRLEKVGIDLQRVGIKDIILPGEMREIINKVVNAEKSAQANVIKRREETAATRSLLNTAKLMEDNPTLLRLKELETLEKLLKKVDTLNISNGFDGVLENLVSLNKK